MTNLNHQERAWQLLNEGMQLANDGKRLQAIDILFLAATTYEKGEDFRQIPAVWEMIGKLLLSIEQMDQDTASVDHETAVKGQEKIQLDYRVMPEDGWKSDPIEPAKRLAWVYEWAAKHKERGNDPDSAQQLFFKAAQHWEKTDEVQKKRPHQAARMYYRAILNHIRYFGTASAAEPKEGKPIFGPIRTRVKGTSGWTTGDPDEARQKMRSLFLRLGTELRQPAKAYKQLSIAYSSLKSALIDSGNIIEAREMEKCELWAARKFHWVAGHPIKWFYYRMRTGGFAISLLIWITAIVLVFPFLYQHYGLQSPDGHEADFIDAALYSAECALILGHRFFDSSSNASHLLSIVETAFSYFGLGATLWYVTKKIE